MLIDEENIVLEAGVKVWLEAQVNNHGVVVTVDVSIHTVHSFENLANETGKWLRERDTWLSSC